MLSSRLFWKLLLASAGLNLAAAVVFGFMLSRSWLWSVAALACAGVLGLSWWLGRHIIRPLTALTQAADSIADGDYGRRIYVANRDELGTLARTINRLSQELDARMQHLGRTGDRQSTALGGMIEGVIAVDQRQRIVLANRAAGRLFEFQPAAAEGRPLIEIVRNHALNDAVMAALASSQPRRLETKSSIQHPGSSSQHVEIHVQPLPGQPCPGVVLVMHDTTELRRLEALRRDFIANVSHELKTPLTSIKAYTETLRNGALQDRDTSQKFLARIEEQTERLHHLIMDMLMLARLESDQEPFELVSVDLPEAVARCLEEHRPAAEAKHIGLIVEPEQPSCYVRADREGLREILDNLIDNAIKYTPEGGRVSVGWEGAGSWGLAAGGEERGTRGDERVVSPQPPVPSPLVRIVVRDTGIGIKAEDQRRVFERFYRVDKARSRELGGTGLGLAIVKHLVQSFGGTVAVESEPGKGSSFAVELPAA
jgi:two-component system phosphate regulon sensor histidine kinase PhoR